MKDNQSYVDNIFSAKFLIECYSLYQTIHYVLKNSDWCIFLSSDSDQKYLFWV